MSFNFKARDGQTPLPEERKKGLKLPHIQSMGELDIVEDSNVSEGLLWLEAYKGGDYLSLYFLSDLHKHMFKKVWNWAGEIRSHELNNPNFSMPYNIRQDYKELEKDVQYWKEKGSYSERAILAHYHHRLCKIHPFTNGNGRLARIVAEYLAQREGWPTPLWGEVYKGNPSDRRRRYIDSLALGDNQHDLRPLEEFMFT